MKYSIQGDTLPVVICELDAGEKIITEGGGMAWMSPNMKMETTGGGIGKMFGRALSGDTLFQNIYTAERTNGMISIASSFPGSIKAFEITPGNEIILQKSAFLASEAGVELSMHFRKKLGSGLFGGEGFILQKLSGNGIAFAEFDGHVIEYELQPGQQIVIDTGHLAAMTATCQMDIQTVPGIKNITINKGCLFFFREQNDGAINGFILKQLCISKVIQTDEHSFFCNQATQFLAGTDLEKFVGYNIADQTIFLDLVDCLLYENKVFVKLLVRCLVLLLIDFYFRTRQQRVHSFGIHIRRIADYYIKATSVVNCIPIKRSNFHHLMVSAANSVQFSLADKGVPKLNIVAKIRKNRNNFCHRRCCFTFNQLD